MTDCKEASTPLAMTTTLTTDSEYLYRSVVGQRQWEAPVRPDGAFTINELARDLNQPTDASFRNLKHLLRYKNEHFTIRFYCNQSSSSIPQGNTSSSLSSQWTQTGQDAQRHERALQVY